MANKSNFNVEEWDLLREIPFLTGLIVVAASPSGIIGLMKESTAAATMIREDMQRTQTELLKTLAEDLKTAFKAPMIANATPEDIRSAGLDALRRLSALLREKASPEEAEEFKCFLGTLAQKVAEASREGGFLGFGGTLVTDEEKSAIDQIAIALR